VSAGEMTSLDAKQQLARKNLITALAVGMLAVLSFLAFFLKVTG